MKLSDGGVVCWDPCPREWTKVVTPPVRARYHINTKNEHYKILCGPHGLIALIQYRKAGRPAGCPTSPEVAGTIWFMAGVAVALRLCWGYSIEVTL